MNERSHFKNLITQARDGDTSAFHSLFERLVDRLYAYALSHTHNKEAAEDIVQETFVELWESLPRFTYEGDAPFLGYVYTILKRKVSWHHRRVANRNTVLLEEKHFDRESETPSYEDHRHLGKLLDMLSEKYQEIIRLRYWSALSYVEIAATLNINETAAKVRHHRALKKLQKLAKKHEYTS